MAKFLVEIQKIFQESTGIMFYYSQYGQKTKKIKKNNNTRIGAFLLFLPLFFHLVSFNKYTRIGKASVLLTQRVNND